MSSEYHFKSLWYDSAGAPAHDLPVVRQTLYHWAIIQEATKVTLNQQLDPVCFSLEVCPEGNTEISNFQNF